jgi:23S rRNA G2445 N2-methylase RlmL
MKKELNKQMEIDKFLKGLLLDFALKHKNQEMFKNLTSNEWQEHIVKDTRLPIQPKFKGVSWEDWSQAIVTTKRLVKDGILKQLNHENVLIVYKDIMEFKNLILGGELA